MFIFACFTLFFNSITRSFSISVLIVYVDVAHNYICTLSELTATCAALSAVVYLLEKTHT